MTSLVSILRNFFLPVPGELAPSIVAADCAEFSSFFETASISTALANAVPLRAAGRDAIGAGSVGMAVMERPPIASVRSADQAGPPLTRQDAADWIALNLAHELNQPLAAITNYVRAGQRLLAAGQPADLDRLNTALDAAMTQALHAGRIVSGLRTFITRGENDRGIEDLSNLIQRATVLAKPDIEKYEVNVATALDPAAERALIDRVQIEQVLVNLIRNATQAMQDRPHRDLCIASRLAGDFVEIAVTDTGGGLPEAVRDQIFAPFVTTRRDGMGVGLAICHAIVAAHGGTLSCQSADRGSSFRFTIPRVADAAA